MGVPCFFAFRCFSSGGQWTVVAVPPHVQACTFFSLFERTVVAVPPHVPADSGCCPSICASVHAFSVQACTLADSGCCPSTCTSGQWLLSLHMCQRARFFIMCVFRLPPR